MVEPVTIASATVGSFTGIAALIAKAISFSNDVQSAKKDISLFIGDLENLRNCLQTLHEGQVYTSFPTNVRIRLLNVLNDCGVAIQDGITLLDRYASPTLMERLHWSSSGESKARKLRQRTLVYVSMMQIVLHTGSLTRNHLRYLNSIRSHDWTSNKPNSGDLLANLRTEVAMLRSQVNQLQHRGQRSTLDESLSVFQSYAESITDPSEDVSDEYSSLQNASVYTILPDSPEPILRDGLSTDTSPTSSSSTSASLSSPDSSLANSGVRGLVASGWSFEESLAVCKKYKWQVGLIQLLAQLTAHGWSPTDAEDSCAQALWDPSNIKLLLEARKSIGYPHDITGLCRSVSWSRSNLGIYLSLREDESSRSDTIQVCEAAGWRQSNVRNFRSLRNKGWTYYEALQACQAVGWMSTKLDQLVVVHKTGLMSEAALTACEAASWTPERVNLLLALRRKGFSLDQSISVCESCNWQAELANLI